MELPKGTCRGPHFQRQRSCRRRASTLKINRHLFVACTFLAGELIEVEIMAITRISAAVAALAVLTVPGAAQAPSLAGKNVQMIIGSGTGGAMDLWGRVIARHIGKHLPGKPTIVSQNMPGAGGFNAVNHI